MFDILDIGDILNFWIYKTVIVFKKFGQVSATDIAIFVNRSRQNRSSMFAEPKREIGTTTKKRYTIRRFCNNQW